MQNRTTSNDTSRILLTIVRLSEVAIRLPPGSPEWRDVCIAIVEVRQSLQEAVRLR